MISKDDAFMLLSKAAITLAERDHDGGLSEDNVNEMLIKLFDAVRVLSDLLPLDFEPEPPAKPKPLLRLVPK
jgi:hypothetical protein